MTDLTLDRLRRGGQALLEEVSREQYLAHAGLKHSAELQPIYARHAAVLGADALSLVRETFAAAEPGSEQHRGARLLLEWQVESQTDRALAELDERQIAWEASATVLLADGRRLPYQRIAIDVANASDRAERLELERARVQLVERELAPLRRERFQREKDVVESLGIASDYLATFEATSGINLQRLVAECEAFLRDTQAMWDDTATELTRAKLGIDPHDATRADALFLLRAREFDPYFPNRDLEATVRRQTAEMGIDADAAGRIRYDTDEREGKHARAFCAPVRVPQEVYLVLRPRGGQSDFRTLLHELGHALHFAYTNPDYPFEYRWIGDNSVTEAYAMLFDHLMQDAGWLLRYTSLGKSSVGAFLRAAGFEELQFLRRYCAKLLYETVLYGGRVAWEALPDHYVDVLTGATSFRYEMADAFVDVDPHLYAARYLRAWQLQALLTDTLVERFDVDWYRNPRTGPWLTQELLTEGQRELAEEIGERLTDRPLSFAPLVRSTESLLVAS